MNFSNTNFEKRYHKRFKPLCEKTPYFFCADKDYTQAPPYISDIDIYVDKHHNAHRMYGELIQDLKNNRANVQTENKEHYTYVSMNNIQKVDQEPVSFRCRDTGDNRYCQTNIVFNSDARLFVAYHVRKENTRQDIMTLHQQTLDLLNAFQQNTFK